EFRRFGEKRRPAPRRGGPEMTKLCVCGANRAGTEASAGKRTIQQSENQKSKKDGGVKPLLQERRGAKRVGATRVFRRGGACRIRRCSEEERRRRCLFRAGRLRKNRRAWNRCEC